MTFHPKLQPYISFINDKLTCPLCLDPDVQIQKIYKTPLWKCKCISNPIFTPDRFSFYINNIKQNEISYIVADADSDQIIISSYNINISISSLDQNPFDLTMLNRKINLYRTLQWTSIPISNDIWSARTIIQNVRFVNP